MKKIVIYNYFYLLILWRIIMAKKNDKISMPQTGAGLVRYFDEESLGPKISPEHVLIATVILAIFCFVLTFTASA